MRISDTLTGSKREFTPISGNQVRMYVCGVTPYAPVHVGHAMSYIVFDVVRRYLTYLGYDVRHVQNFTDVDDKLIDRANQGNTTVKALAQQFIDDYFQSMDSLNILRAHEYPKASQEVPGMLEMIGGLIEKGYAYESSGDVYFRVVKNADYGKLSHRSLDTMRAGARLEVSELKEHPMDFVLWKAAKPGEPTWDSPWGPGRPGWHIECSVMSRHYLGSTIDIHGGGQDLIFPHHENEIAQSEAFEDGDAPFSQFWMHNGLLQLDKEKMSKSLGNLVTVKETLARFEPDAIRLFVLQSHYRSPLSYSEESLEGAKRAALRLRQAVNLKRPENTGDALDASAYCERFKTAMDDDFNTPQAVAALFDLAREINRAVEHGRDVDEAQETMRELGGQVLGFTYTDPDIAVSSEMSVRIQALVDKRQALRTERNFAEADAARDDLTALGVTLTDTPIGTEWHLQG
jgi:cysteinyl-tRNA synthetase